MRIRPASPSDAPEIALVHVDSWREAYREILAPDILETLSYEARQQMWEQVLGTQPQRTVVYVAETEDCQLVGFISAGKNRESESAYKGEIYALYLLAAYQGRGWGKQLFEQAARGLSAEGYGSFMLWVLADNPTRGFYEAMGGIETGQKEIVIGGDSYTEVAYGWTRFPRGRMPERSEV